MTFHQSFRSVRCTAFRLCKHYGVKIGRFGRQRPFSPKYGLKTAILGLTILDRLTSEGAGTQIFEAIANFSMCFEKFGTLSSKWAMGKASSFNIARTTGRYFFGRGGHEKLQKNDFFRKTLAPEKFIIENFFQHRTMWKLTSGRFRKCISYEAYGDFYASYANFRAQNAKLWPCLFFWTPHNFRDAFTFSAMCWLWAVITGVKITVGLITYTFSESSGR